MSKITLSGNASGTGTLLIAAPNTSSDITLNLPTTMGTNNGSSIVTTNAAGSLGLGVAPSAWSGFKVFELPNGASIGQYSTTSTLFLNSNAYFNGSSWIYKTSAGSSRYQVNIGTHEWFTAPSGTAGAAISFAQAMTLDASGNLAIGTTSYRTAAGFTAFAINGTSGSLIDLYAGGTRHGGISATSGATYVSSVTSIPLVFSTADTERARINSAGVLLIGTTSFAAGQASKAIGPNEILSSRNTTAPSSHLVFYNPNGAVGQIYTDGTGTLYITTSDYRLKENIQPMTGALQKVQALKPVTYKWKIDGSDGQGFIAHELAEVEPSCVAGEKDAVDADGKPQYQGIDTSFLVATLTAAIQELHAIVAAQGLEIATLKGQA